MRLLLPLVLLLWQLPALAQTSDSIKLSGKVTCPGDSISLVSIKAEWKKAGYIVAYLKADKNGDFIITTPFGGPDTLAVTFTRTGYRSIRRKFAIMLPMAIQINLVMEPAVAELDTVQVKAPPVWRRGDTTFYRVDAFTKGHEQKLIQAIRNMPDLEITPEGDLLFKRKRVEKIMVEGQELFADQVKMLLSNTPLHIIKNVQLLENQNEDTLMNGLGGGKKVFMNLELKEGVKWQFAFGDAHAGVGTLNRYLLNPVLFSIRGKVKTGLIANINNSGDIPDYSEMRQLKSYNSSFAVDGWLIGDNRVQSLPGFTSTSYLQNQQVQSQLQVNYHLGKQTTAQSQLVIYFDNRQQQVFTSSELQQADSFFIRKDAMSIRYRPALGQLRQHINISTLKRSSWKIDAAVTGDISKFRSATNYQYNRQTSSNSEKLAQQLWSVALKSHYTHRKNISQAFEWQQNLNLHHLPQQLSGLSPNWEQVFQISNSGNYNNLHLHYTEKLGSLQDDFTWTRNKAGKTKKQQLLFNSEWNNVAVDQWLVAEDHPTTDTISIRKQDGRYMRASILYARRGYWSFSKPYKLHWSAEAGAGGVMVSEPGRQYNKLAPQWMAGIEIKNKKNLGQLPELSVNFKRQFDRLFYYPGIYLPRGLTSYSSHSSLPRPISEADASLTGNGKFGTTKLYWFGTAIYHYTWQSYLQSNRYNEFVYVGTDSLLKKPTQYFYTSASLTYGFDPYHPANKMELEFNYNFSNYWIETGNEIVQSWRKTLQPSFELSHQLSKWLLAEATTKFQASYYGNNSVLKTEKPWRNNWYASMQLTSGIGTQHQLQLKGEWGINDWKGTSENELLFCNLQYSYKWPKKKITIQLNLNNIFDQQNYSTLVTTARSRYYTQIPLVGRNLFLSCRYEL